MGGPAAPGGKKVPGLPRLISLAGKTVLVTGAGGGIGRDFALAMAAATFAAPSNRWRPWLLPLGGLVHLGLVVAALLVGAVGRGQQAALRIRDEGCRERDRRVSANSRMQGAVQVVLRREAGGNACLEDELDHPLVRIESFAVDPDATDRALKERHTRVFDLSGGRPMKG